MNNMHFVNPRPKKKPNNKGFYTALGICLLAIAVAAVMTYSDIYNIFSPSKSETSKPEDTSSQMVNDAVQTVPHISETTSSELDTTKLANATPESQSSDKDESNDETSNEEPSSFSSPNVYPSGKNVIKSFSNGNPVYSVTLNDWRVHDGTDFAADKGSMVRAITDGTVKEIYTDQFLGKVIVIDHGDFEAYYCGLGETTLVNPGDNISMAHDIGSIKSVPGEILEQDHLHLAIKKDGSFIDPMTILGDTSEESTEE